MFRLLGAESIGLQLSDGFAFEPEQSTVALVVHHPQAIYFAMRSGRLPQDAIPDQLIAGSARNVAGEDADPAGQAESGDEPGDEPAAEPAAGKAAVAGD